MTICSNRSLTTPSHSSAISTGQLGSTRTATMPGQADGGGGMVKRHAKKRELDDALLGLGTGSRDAKRRRTAGGPGHRHDGSTSNSSSLSSHGEDFNGDSALKSSKFQHDILPFSSRPSDSPAPPARHSLRAPNGSHSAAKASGAPGSSRGSRGAKPSSLGGLFSGRGHDKSHQNYVPNGPPNSSSTSSDASSIPTGSTQTFPTIAPRGKPQTSSNFLRYGKNSANREAAGQRNPQNHNTKHVPGSQGQQSGPQDNIPSASRLKKTLSVNSPSNDVSYLENGDVDSDDSDNSLPARKQFWDPEHTTRHSYYSKTILGKDYCEVSGEALSWARYT